MHNAKEYKDILFNYEDKTMTRKIITTMTRPKQEYAEVLWSLHKKIELGRLNTVLQRHGRVTQWIVFLAGSLQAWVGVPLRLKKFLLTGVATVSLWARKIKCVVWSPSLTQRSSQGADSSLHEGKLRTLETRKQTVVNYTCMGRELLFQEERCAALKPFATTSMPVFPRTS